MKDLKDWRWWAMFAVLGIFTAVLFGVLALLLATE